jgi:hypothetical protein
MDIDTLILERVGPAGLDEVIAPAPGCLGQTDTTCWVAAGQNVYTVKPLASNQPALTLAPGQGFQWINSAISWAPDGLHLAYSVLQEAGNQAELRIYNAATSKTQSVALGVDPTIEAAWTAACADGLPAEGCELAYKTEVANSGEAVLPHLVAFTPATGEQRQWEISSEPIFELRWGADNKLLYSRPKRHFYHVEDHSPAYSIPVNSRLASLSPDANHTIYYQPFTLQGCQPQDTENSCLHLGVWLAGQSDEADDRRLIYNVDLSEPRAGGLNFIPLWSPQGDAFVFFQEGNLIHYNMEQQAATIWYKSVQGKLRSAPVFSPNEEAVAFVDNQGQGYSEYRLVIVNPRLQPVEHIIDTQTGFRVLAWLPN